MGEQAAGEDDKRRPVVQSSPLPPPPAHASMRTAAPTCHMLQLPLKSSTRTPATPTR